MIALVRRHSRVLGLTALVVAVLVAVALWWFQPQRLLYDDTVNEALPTPVAVATAERQEQQDGEPKRTRMNADRLPMSRASATPGPAESRLTVVVSGQFRSRGHAGSGTASVLDLGAGQRVLRLEDFSTTNGPDLRVYLSPASADAPNDELNDGAVSLGHLKGNRGDQNYSVPADLRLSDYSSLVIWCKRFSYAFTTAPLG